jgi:hypothetical protein
VRPFEEEEARRAEEARQREEAQGGAVKAAAETQDAVCAEAGGALKGAMAGAAGSAQAHPAAQHP